MQTEIPQEALDKMKREGWASLEEQKAYWDRFEDRNECEKDWCTHRPLDFTEATCRWYDEWWQPAPDEERDAYINDYDAGGATDE